MKGEKTSVLRTIAEKAGVSVSTVSVVLNNRGDQMRIAKATQQRIFEAAQTENYSPNVYARKLRKSDRSSVNKVVGVFWNQNIMNESMGWFFSNAYRTIRENDLNMELSLHFFQPRQLRDSEEFKDLWRFNGLIVFGLWEEDIQFLAEQKFDIPVLISAPAIEGRIHGAYIDNIIVGGIAADRLAEYGYKKIGVVWGKNALGGAFQRGTEFVRRAMELGLRYEPEWCVEINENDFVAAGREIINMMNTPAHPDALFIPHQTSALSAAVAVSRWRQMTGEDCALVFCYHDPGIEAIAENSATIDINNREYASECVRIIWKLMNEKNSEYVCVTIPPVEHLDNLAKKIDTYQNGK